MDIHPVAYLVFSGLLAVSTITWTGETAALSLNDFSLSNCLQHCPAASLALFNFLLSFIACFYFFLCLVFFGPPLYSPPNESQQVFEKLLVFFSFKFVLIGLVIEPGMIDGVIWIIWCANLAVAKAIIHHGLIHAEYLAGANAGPTEYIRPSFHVPFVILYALGMYQTYGLWVSGRPTAFWLLFLFDIVTLLIELAHSATVYIIYIVNGFYLKQYFTDPAEKACTINMLTDILMLNLTLVHFAHVCFLNGLTLSLTDVLLFLNIRSTCIQLVKRLDQLRAHWVTRKNMDKFFPSCEASNTAGLIDDRYFFCTYDADFYYYYSYNFNVLLSFCFSYHAAVLYVWKLSHAQRSFHVDIMYTLTASVN